MKIIQFGTGRFLRGFFAPIVSETKSITVVQSRLNSSGADEINAQPDGYHVWTRGIEKGETVDRFEKVESIDRAIVAQTEWTQLLERFCDPQMQLVVSNTTAAGLNLDESDAEYVAETCPSSFPAKLASLLFQRFKQGEPVPCVLPLELVENNASQLRQLVEKQIEIWGSGDPELVSPEFKEWFAQIRWLNNLVDRIVVSPSDDPPWKSVDHLAVVGEPFRMLAIEDDGKGHEPIPQDPMITWAPDLSRFFLRKVRILNGLHTAMVAKFLPQGFETVLECVSKPESRKWLEEVLHEEILPALDSLGLEEREFAAQVMERFENPFFEHRLSDIANGHETKLDVRIRPTVLDFEKANGNPPPRLSEVLDTKLPAGVG